MNKYREIHRRVEQLELGHECILENHNTHWHCARRSVLELMLICSNFKADRSDSGKGEHAYISGHHDNRFRRLTGSEYTSGSPGDKKTMKRQLLQTSEKVDKAGSENTGAWEEELYVHHPTYHRWNAASLGGSSIGFPIWSSMGFLKS